jgi:hypothetical protein
MEEEEASIFDVKSITGTRKVLVIDVTQKSESTDTDSVPIVPMYIIRSRLIGLETLKEADIPSRTG